MFKNMIVPGYFNDTLLHKNLMLMFSYSSITVNFKGYKIPRLVLLFQKAETSRILEKSMLGGSKKCLRNYTNQIRFFAKDEKYKDLLM